MRVRGTDVLATIAWAAPPVAALVLAFHSGGYFISSWGVASVLLLGLLTTSALLIRGSLGGRAGAVAMAGWAGLAAWQGISSAWAYQPSAAIAAMNLTLLYAAAFALVLVGVRRVADLDALMHTTLAVCALVVGYSVVQRLLPDLVSGDLPGRLASPLTYWNGLGALAAFGALLAVAGAGTPGRTPWLAAVHAALVPALLLALLLTFSRGAFAALIIGAALLIALAPGRIETVVALVTSVGISIPLLAIANGEDTIASLSRRIEPDPDAGRRVFVVLLISMAAAAILSLAVTFGARRLPSVSRRRTGVAMAAVAVVTIAVVAVVRMPSEGPVTWVERQVNSFQSYDTASRTSAASIADRLAVSAGSGRWQNWEVATDEFRTSPVVGTGAGDYRYFWESERPMDLSVRNAHSLYLEALAEIGVIGLLLMLIPIAAVGTSVGLALRRRPPAPVARSLAVALAAGGVIGAHAAGDWDWQLPAVVIPAIALGAGALKVAHLVTRSEGAPAEPAWGRWALALGALLAIVFVAGPLASSASLTRARDLAASGALEPALAEARQAQDIDRQSPEPWLLEANLLTDLGRPAEADRAFAGAAARSPRDWLVFADWASALLRRGDAAAAQVAARQAARLNPLEPRPRYLLEATRA